MSTCRTLSVRAILAVVLGGAVSSHATLAAQSSSASGHRQRVTVALVETLPVGQDFAAAVVRTPGPEGRDIILLPRATATGQLLEQATQVVLHSRIRQGDHPTTVHGKSFKQMVLGVRSRSVAASSWSPSELAAAQSVVTRLPTARVREIPGIGKAPALDFVPPPILLATSDRRPRP